MTNRFLVFGLGSAGDVHPNVDLCLRLRERGHEVLLIASPVFRPLAEQLSLPFVAIGSEEQYREAIDDPDLWHPFKAFPTLCQRLLLPMMRPVYEVIASHYQPGRTVAVAPATAFGARIAQEHLGIPLATLHLQPSMIRSCYETPVYGRPDPTAHLPRWLRSWYFGLIDRLLIDRLLGPEVNAFRASLGLGPVSGFFDRWLHSPDLVVGFFPEWYAEPQPDWPPDVHPVGFPLYDAAANQEPDPELEAFLASGSAPIVFTAGTAMRHSGEFFAASVRACVANGWRGILLTQFRELAPAGLPETIRHFGYVAFSRLLPRSSALVHHGGIGTAAQALAAGIPQLIVPLAHDQFDNAARVRRLGVGTDLLPRHYNEARLVRVLRSLLEDPSVRESCSKVADRVKPDAAAGRVCALLEQLAGVTQAA